MKSCANSQEKSRSIRYSMLMAGIRGKSGPPANQNAFKHGLAAIQKRREESVTTEHEESVRHQILERLKVDIDGYEVFSRRLSPRTAQIVSLIRFSRMYSHYPDRTEAFSIKTGLSICAVMGFSSLRDELPEFRRDVLEMIGSH